MHRRRPRRAHPGQVRPRRPGAVVYFAEYEAEKIRLRTVAELKQARAEGKRLGQPSTFDEHRAALDEMLDGGVMKFVGS